MIIFPTFNNPSKWVTLVGGGSTNQLFHGPKWLNLKKVHPGSPQLIWERMVSYLEVRSLSSANKTLGYLLSIFGWKTPQIVKKAPLKNPLWKTWWCEKSGLREYWFHKVISWTNQDVNGGILLKVARLVGFPISRMAVRFGEAIGS